MDIIIDHDQIIKELEKFDYIPEPETEVGFQEEVVCHLNIERLRNVYSLAILWRNLGIEKIEETIKNDDKNTLALEALEIISFSNTLMNIFYSSIRSHFYLWDREVDVRKGWKIVVSKDIIFIVNNI